MLTKVERLMSTVPKHTGVTWTTWTKVASFTKTISGGYRSSARQQVVADKPVGHTQMQMMKRKIVKAAVVVITFIAVCIGRVHMHGYICT